MTALTNKRQTRRAEGKPGPFDHRASERPRPDIEVQLLCLCVRRLTGKVSAESLSVTTEGSEQQNLLIQQIIAAASRE